VSAERRGPGGDHDALMIMAAELAAEKARSDRLAAELAGVLDRIAALPVTADGNTGPLPRFPARAGAGRGTRRAGDRPRFRLIKGGLAAFLPIAALKHAARAHRVMAAAAAAMTGSAVVGGALVATVPAITHAAAGPSAGASSAVPGWHTSAVPLTPKQAKYVAEVTRARQRKHGAGLVSAASSLPVLPPWTPAPFPSSSSPAPSQPSQTQAAAGSAVLQVPVDGIDLTSGTPQTIMLTATGDGGWVSWQVKTAGTDLDFSKMSGVLRPGQTAEVTVSVDPAEAQDQAMQQTFTVNGQPVVATLQAPQPAVTPAPVDTSTVMPSDTPSPGSS